MSPHEELAPLREAEESAAERCARRRGYDYDPHWKPGLIEQVSSHITLVIDGGDPDFGTCEVCGEPAALVVPWNAAVAGQRHFCGMGCFRPGANP